MSKESKLIGNSIKQIYRDEFIADQNDHPAAVIWDSDFDFEDYGLEGEGIINHCQCTNCGADIDYYVGVDENE